METKMDFELELGELRPLFGRDEGFKDIPPFNHILCNGEIYRSVYDKDCGTIWICITDDKKEDMYGYNYDSKNPFMVQVITYKRTKEKVVTPKEKETTEIFTDYGTFKVLTKYINNSQLKYKVCKSQIYEKEQKNILIDMEFHGITLQEAHSKACLVGKTLFEKKLKLRK